MTPFITAFCRPDPSAGNELDLQLAAARRGHTVSLVWQVKDGALVAAGTPLFVQFADADSEEKLTVASPVPARVTILQPAGRFLTPGLPVCRLTFGALLEQELNREWQECALELAAELGSYQKAGILPQLSPREILDLVLLEFGARKLLEHAGRKTPPAVLPPGLLTDQALGALQSLCQWKVAAVRADTALPPEVQEETIAIWENLFVNMRNDLRQSDLAPEDGLS